MTNRPSSPTDETCAAPVSDALPDDFARHNPITVTASSSDLPAGDEVTYSSEATARELGKAAAFMLFSHETVGEPDEVVNWPDGSDQIIGINLAREVRRLEIVMRPALSKEGPWSATRLGQVVGRLTARFRLAPEDFLAVPGQEPPPTALDPTRPQPFVLLDGQVRLNDRPKTGLRVFAVGTTAPTAAADNQLDLRGVCHVVGESGRLRGRPGVGALTGTLTVPNRVRCAFVVRVPAATGDLITRSALHPVWWTQEEADHRTAFLTLRGEADPDSPRMLIPGGSGGRARGAHMVERLRVTYVAFDLGSDRSGFRARTVLGPVVAQVTHSTVFRPGAGGAPDELEMRDVIFTFFAADGGQLGTVRADRVTGAVVSGAGLGGADTARQIVGVGPVTAANGPLAAPGTVMVTGALSLFPDAFSTLYVLRLTDPAGRLSAAAPYSL